MANLAGSLMRAAFSASERLAPSIGGRLAFKLFCRTPAPANLSPGEQSAIAKASDFMASARHHPLTVSSGCVVLHEFRPGGMQRGRRSRLGTVLVVHGWRSRTEYMRVLIQGLLDAGYHVVSLDLPGNGASSGRRLDMRLGVEAVRAAADWFGPFNAIVGHSFGGAIAINAAAGSIPAIAAVETGRIVTIASPTRIERVFDGFARMVGLGPRTTDAFKHEVLRIAGRPIQDYDSVALLGAHPIPTLVLHAPDDREVEAAEAARMEKVGPHVSVRWFEGLGHRRILSHPDVVAAAMDFVAQPQLLSKAA